MRNTNSPVAMITLREPIDDVEPVLVNEFDAMTVAEREQFCADDGGGGGGDAQLIVVHAEVHGKFTRFPCV